MNTYLEQTSWWVTNRTPTKRSTHPIQMAGKSLDHITLSTFNCNGLRSRDSRIKTFNWLREDYKGIILLQETHSIITDEFKWATEWAGSIYFSHGTSDARGVADPSLKKYKF